MNKKFILVLSLIICLLFTGCGAAADNHVEAPVAMSKAAGMEYAEEAMVEETAAFDNGYSGAPAPEIENPNRKLIKTVYMSIETKDLDSLLIKVYDKLDSVGGYAQSSQAYNPSVEDKYSRRYTYLELRVPSDSLDAFVNEISGIGNVINKNENVTDVTLNYTDVESHKKSLEIERDRLNELMSEARDVDAIIALETRLSEIRYELDSYESQLRTYDNQVDYSTVTLDISEVVDYTPQVEDSVWTRIKTGFVSTLNGLGRFFKDLFVGIVVFSPVILIVAAIVVILILIIKKIKKKKEAKKAGINENDKISAASEATEKIGDDSAN